MKRYEPDHVWNLICWGGIILVLLIFTVFKGCELGTFASPLPPMPDRVYAPIVSTFTSPLPPPDVLLWMPVVMR